MAQVFQIGVLLAAAAMLAPAEQGATRPGAMRPAGPRGGVPARRPNALGPPLTNPANPLAKLYRATPDQRDRALEKLPPPLQERFRRNLAWFDRLPTNQQDIVVKQSERFTALTPEKRRAFMQQMKALSQLPPERRQAVARALRRLQVLPDEDRAAMLDSEQFMGQFTAGEQKIIGDLSEVMVPPL